MPSPVGGLEHPSLQAWPRFLVLVGILLPCISFAVNPNWVLPPFSPRQVINSNDLLPLIIALWAGPTNFRGVFSRLIQAALIWRIPIGTLDLARAYSLWIAIALARILAGFVFTRSVGWALPRLFSHYALYEVSSGCGPILAGFLLTLDASEVLKIVGLRHRSQDLVVGMSLVLCWLDAEPWTYAITALVVGALALAHLIILHLAKEQHPLGLNTAKKSTVSRRSVIGMVLALVSLIILFNILLSFVSLTPRSPMPDPPFPPARLLDIIILSFPRPNTKAAETILTATLASYLPILSSSVGLGVFTHVSDHPAFDNVQKSLASSQNISFFKDTDVHTDAHSGQYLHLAEAFRWQSERGPSQAEWIMLVEDDFPLCGNDVGQNALRTVMKLLEEGREGRSAIPTRRGAFIGTGGSGLIFHRSLLPIMVHILRTHADITSKLPPNIPMRPADVVLQDCLLGHDPLCPPEHPGGLIITSRLVMDHIGGMFSTNTQKAANSDKWRCGWRHAFHGMNEVDVVVVDDLW